MRTTRNGGKFDWANAWVWLLLLVVSLLRPTPGGAAEVPTTVLHLKNGDRLAGTIVSEDTNRVVITTTWIKELAVPLTAIERREVLPAPTALAKSPPSPSAGTNGLPASKPGDFVPVAQVPSPPQWFATNKHWKVDARIGADFLYNAKDQETYYGRAKLTYELPYAHRPKEFFRNVLDYTVNYGRTDGELAADNMDGSDKMDLDIGKRWYLYNLTGAGYDKVRKIDLRFEVGPGIGYHLVNTSNFVLNVEAGMDYQAQYRSDGTNQKDYLPRLAEDVTWKLNRSLTFTEKLEYFPAVNTKDYRVRFEGTLSYGFWHYLSLNLSVLDLYEAQPAVDVPNNDLEIHSSVGVTF